MVAPLAVGKMYKPTDIENNVLLDAVFVVEQRNHRISKWEYTPGLFDFTLDTSWGSNGDGTSGQPGQATADDDDKLFLPTGIVSNGNNQLLVTDTFNNRIRVIDETDGSFDDSFGTSGVQGDLEFFRPVYMNHSTSNDRIAISDSRRPRVAVVDGTTFAFIANVEEPPGGFHTPNGIQFNSATDWAYTDLVRGIIDQYEADAVTFESSLGTPGTDPSVPTQLFYPGSGNGVEVGGDPIFADTRNNKIKRFDGTIFEEGNFVAGTGEGELYWPDSVTGFFDSVHYNLVVNTRNNRIDVFDESWDVQSTFGFPA